MLFSKYYDLLDVRVTERKRHAPSGKATRLLISVAKSPRALSQR